MTETKKVEPTYILEWDNLYQALLNKPLAIHHLNVFKLIIYVFIYEEKQN